MLTRKPLNWRNRAVAQIALSTAAGALGALLCLLCVKLVAGIAAAPRRVYDVRDFGARGDGLTKDTGAIQAALDRAAAGGGGSVVVPAGRYLSGTLHLRSNVAMQFAAGAVLLASPDDNDFDPYETPTPGSINPGAISWSFKFHHRAGSRWGARMVDDTADNPDTTYAHYALLVGDGVANVTLEGAGAIDGNRNRRGGPKLIALKNCRHVALRGLTLRNAPSYNVSLSGSQDVDIEGLRIVNGYADGIDPDNSRFVRIADCYIDTWDDAICAKASLALGRRLATEDLVVTNCILRTSNNGFKFGTESEGDLRNVSFSNSVVMRRAHGRAPITGVDFESVDGGNVSGVAISNLVMRGVGTPIFVRLGDRGRGQPEPIPGRMQDISISNVVALDAAGPSAIVGLPGAPIRELSLSNIEVVQSGRGRFAGLAVPELAAAYPYGGMFGPLPAYSLYVRHVRGLSVNNWRTRWSSAELRPAAVFDDVSDLQVVGFRAKPALGNEPLLLLDHVEQAFIEAFSVPRLRRAVVAIEDSSSRDITVARGSATEHAFLDTDVAHGPAQAPPLPSARFERTHRVSS